MRIQRRIAMAGVAIAATCWAGAVVHVGGRQSRPARPSADAVTPLIEAVWKDDAVRARQLLDAGEDVTGADEQGIAPWMWALLLRDSAMKRLFFDRRPAFMPGPEDGPMGLFVAAGTNDVEAVRVLLERGVPVDTPAVDKATPLLVAGANGHLGVVRTLLERGARPDVKDDHGDTPLMAAVRAGSIPVIRALLASGADHSRQDKQGRTAVQWAARSGRADVARVLREAGAVESAGVSTDRRGAPSVRGALDRSVPLLQKGAATWIETAGCLACHHQPLILRVTALAARRGLPVDASLEKVQRARVDALASQMNSVAAQAARTEHGVLRSAQRNAGDAAFSIASLGAALADIDGLPAGFGDGALLLGRMQRPEGRWRFGPPRIPIESSDIATTALAARVLRTQITTKYGYELSARVQRARSWLARTRAATLDDKAYRLLGLHWTGADHPIVASAAAALMHAQNRDGGWGQLNGLNSDAYATGLALVALRDAGGVQPGDPSHLRGVAYLLRTQEPDGSWLVHKRAIPMNRYFESGFPHGKFQFISYAGTGWATLALLRALDGAQAGVPRAGRYNPPLP